MSTKILPHEGESTCVDIGTHHQLARPGSILIDGAHDDVSLYLHTIGFQEVLS